MAVMLSKTHDALVAAGAPEEKARAAAEELAGYESRFAKMFPGARGDEPVELVVRIAQCREISWLPVHGEPRP